MYGISIWYILVPSLVGAAGTIGGLVGQWLSQRSQARMAETQRESSLTSDLRLEVARVKANNVELRNAQRELRDVMLEMVDLISELDDESEIDQKIEELIRKGMRSL